MSNIKILVSCHKPTRTLKNNLLIPIQVGCVNTEKRLEGMLADDTGDNISKKNPMYCELTAQYWAGAHGRECKKGFRFDVISVLRGEPRHTVNAFDAYGRS